MINVDTDILTKEQFDGLGPEGKGYAVYMCGSRPDQPNVPESYEPALEDQAEYASGLHRGVIDAQDCP